MANVMFSVLVLIFAQKVFAYECPTVSQKIMNCDECIRCGNRWCSDPKIMSDHCLYLVNDDWCAEPEQLTQIESIQRAGQTMMPAYAERSISFDRSDELSFYFDSSVQRKVSHYIQNTTQNIQGIEVEEIDTVTCDGKRCKFNLVTKVNHAFCRAGSTDMEFIYITVKVENSTETAVVKYQVPCVCSCSKNVERQSPRCNGNGDFSCGVCSCQAGWKGNQCEETDGNYEVECETKRGDVQCTNPLKDELTCSGNGYCGPCDTCICYNNMTGSQYFDRSNFCSDICMDTSGCEMCLKSGGVGPCARSAHEAECTHDVVLLKYNETYAAMRDRYNRREWVSCNNTFKEPDCYVEYLAMKTEAGIHIMVVNSCNNYGAGAVGNGPNSSKVPVILGVLAVLAVVAAAGGFMLWKHLSAVPPMPFSSPDYQNIDAEDCVGENPLYKSPTSTFTNPQFGKCS